jgi:8-oxo-dGTP diphosphatase
MTGAPKHSVSVAGIVIRDDGLILAVQRRDNARWEPPGGVLELGETFEEGVRREVAEETGIQVEVECLTGAYKNLPRGVVALVFRCRPTGGLASPTVESRRVQWLTPDQVRSRMAPAYAVRVFDSLAGRSASRAHDGVDLIDRGAGSPRDAPIPR